MRFYFFTNQQRKRADGSMPVYICIARPPKRFYIHTGMFSKSVVVDGIFPRSEMNHKAKTIRLNEYMEQVEKVAWENSTMPQDELRELIMEKVFGKGSRCKTLHEYIMDYSALCRTERTKDLYKRTADKVRRYDSKATLSVNLGWLEDFTRSMQCEGLKVNSYSIHLRNLRTVFNYAIKHDLTTNYPFKHFPVPTEETRKRNLPLERIRKIFAAEDLPQEAELARDIFCLMFMLLGINGVDLLNATPDQIVNGRFEYRRSKTGKLFSIEITPEAQEIIDKYKGKKHVLCFCDFAHYRRVMMKINKGLKYFGSDVTTYYARHTWATIAASIDIPMETIAAALGHSLGFRVTSIYVEFNQKKIDEANRKVIGYILGKTGQ